MRRVENAVQNGGILQKTNCFIRKIAKVGSLGSDHFRGKGLFLLSLPCSDGLLLTYPELKLILQCSLIFILGRLV